VSSRRTCLASSWRTDLASSCVLRNDLFSILEYHISNFVIK
jgi:hypothetical protein